MLVAELPEDIERSVGIFVGGSDFLGNGEKIGVRPGLIGATVEPSVDYPCEKMHLRHRIDGPGKEPGIEGDLARVAANLLVLERSQVIDELGDIFFGGKIVVVL